jgi:hypothetical protein
MDVVGPFLREAGFSTDSGHLCFNKEILHQVSVLPRAVICGVDWCWLLHELLFFPCNKINALILYFQISEAIAKSTSEESRPISVAASLRKIKDFEGCGVRETYSFLIVSSHASCAFGCLKC